MPISCSGAVTASDRKTNASSRLSRSLPSQIARASQASGNLRSPVHWFRRRRRSDGPDGSRTLERVFLNLLMALDVWSKGLILRQFHTIWRHLGGEGRALTE